jgi:hypothetical protein
MKINKLYLFTFYFQYHLQTFSIFKGKNQSITNLLDTESYKHNTKDITMITYIKIKKMNDIFNDDIFY